MMQIFHCFEFTAMDRHVYKGMMRFGKRLQ
jgi:hypothetical protein